MSAPSFYGSLGRLANQYASVVAPHVSPSVVTSGKTEDIAGPGARALAIGRGGRSTKATSRTPADFNLSPSLAGELNPEVFSKSQQALARDVPASAQTINPTYRFQYKAKPFKIGELILGLESKSDKDQLIPLPQPRDLAFLIDEDFARLNRSSMASSYEVNYTKLANRYGGLKELDGVRNAGSMVFHSTQEARLANLIGINKLLTHMEIADWEACADGDEYIEHFYDKPARSEFQRYFSLMGGVDLHGDAAASGVRFHRSGGVDAPQIVDLTTAGQFICYDYVNGLGNVEGASVNLVFTRVPVKSGTTVNLGYNNATNYPGAYTQSINFVPRADMGRFKDVIYPIQAMIVAWPDGTVLPRRYYTPTINNPHLNGADAVSIGRLTFRNIGNVKKESIFGFSNMGFTGHYKAPLNSLNEYVQERSTYDVSRRRPIQILLNGNPDQ